MLVVAVTVPVFAGTRAGMNEFGGAFTITKSTQEGSDPSWMAMFSLNRFPTATFSVGIVGVVMGSEGEYDGVVGLRTDWYSSTASDTVPYIGGRAMRAVGEDVSSDITYGPQIGLKHFLGESLSVNYEVSYTTTTDNSDVGIYRGMIGLSYYF